MPPVCGVRKSQKIHMYHLVKFMRNHELFKFKRRVFYNTLDLEDRFFLFQYKFHEIKWNKIDFFRF